MTQLQAAGFAVTLIRAAHIAQIVGRKLRQCHDPRPAISRSPALRGRVLRCNRVSFSRRPGGLCLEGDVMKELAREGLGWQDAHGNWHQLPDTAQITAAAKVLFAQDLGSAEDFACEWELLKSDYLACAREMLEAAGASTNAQIEALRARVAELEAERDTPETADFIEGVKREAAHQRYRWGVDHDAGKTPFDWFWLIGYLAQKAANAAVQGDSKKAMHHTISTAAALANWHLFLAGVDTRMRPGIDPSLATLAAKDNSDG